MAIVGRAYVTLRVIVDQVGRDIERAIVPAAEKAGTQAGDLIGRKIKDGVSKASKEIAAKPPTVKPRLDTAEMQAKIDRLQAKLDLLATKSPSIQVDVDIAEAMAKIAALRAALAVEMAGAGAGVGEKIGDDIAKGVKKSAKKDGGGFGAGKLLIGAIVAFGPGLVQVATGYIGQVLALAASIGPAIAAGAVVGLSSMVALMSTIKLVGVAFKAQTRSAMSFKESLHNIGAEVGQTVGRNMFPALNKALDDLSHTILPGLNHELKVTGSAFGHVIRNLADLAASPSFGPVLQGAVEQNAHLFRKLGFAFDDVILTVITLIRAARPLTQAFGDWVQGSAAAFRSSVDLAVQTGALRDWFIKAGATAATLGDILIHTFQGLGGFFAALRPQGDSLLESIDKAAAHFALLKDSGRGQNSIAKFFSDLKPITDGFNRLLGELGHSLADIVRGDGGNFVSFLDTLGTAVHSLVDLWIPVSQITLPIISLLVQALGALAAVITPVATAMGPLITGIVGMVLAFKGVTAAVVAVKELKIALMGLSATNPIILGISVAIGIAVVAYSVFHKSQEDAKQDAADLKTLEDELTTTLDQQTGAVTRGTNARIIDHLQKKGAYDDARLLGIATRDVTLAAEGNVAAQGRVNAAIDASIPKRKLSSDAGAYARQTSLKLTDAQKDELAAGERLTGTIHLTTTATRVSQGALRERNRELRVGKGDQDGYRVSAGQLSRNQELLGEKSQGAATAIRHQIDAIRELNNLTLARLNSNIAYQQQLDDTRKEIEKGTKTLDTSTQAGRDNKLSLTALITSAGAVTGSSKHQAQVLKEARDQVVAYAEACGMTGPAARLFADSMIKGTQASEANKKADEQLATHLEKVLKPSLHDLITEYSGVPGKVDTVAEFKKTQAHDDADNLAEFIKKRVPGVSETVAQFKADQARIDARNLRNYINGKEGLGGVHDKVVNVSFKVSAAQLNKVDSQLGTLAGGGWVSGPGTTTSDSILARLSNQEFVVRAKQAAKFAGLLQAINNDTVPGFAGGGSIGRSSAPAALGSAALTNNYVVYARDFNDLQRQAQRLARHSAVGGVSMVGRH